MTFSDWTYTNGDPSLDDSTYVSTPTSIRFLGTATNQQMYAISKKSEVQSLINGRIVDSVRASALGSGSYSTPLFYFRFQNTSNFYDIYFDLYSKKVYLQKCVAGVLSSIDNRTLTFTPVINTWYKFRITFWEVASVLYVRIEYWNDSAWVTQGADMDHYPPLWPTGGKVGIGAINAGTALISTWHDDTELWG